MSSRGGISGGLVFVFSSRPTALRWLLALTLVLLHDCMGGYEKGFGRLGNV